MKFPLNKVVEIERKDACYRGGWAELKEYESLEPMDCKTVGYLIKKTDSMIVLGLTQALDGAATGGISIPIPWIKKLRTLK